MTRKKAISFEERIANWLANATPFEKLVFELNDHTRKMERYTREFMMETIRIERESCALLVEGWALPETTRKELVNAIRTRGEE